MKKSLKKQRTDKLTACHKKSTPETDTHKTPPAFFEAVQKKFKIKFSIDIAATKKNTLCKKYITKEQNALESSWQGNAWCNPPYSLTYEFVEKCMEMSSHSTTFLLLAVRSDQDWWHEFVRHAFAKVFIKGRLKFVGADSGAPFPSILLIFKRGHKGPPRDIYWAPTPYERGFQRGKPK